MLSIQSFAKLSFVKLIIQITIKIQPKHNFDQQHAWDDKKQRHRENILFKCLVCFNLYTNKRGAYDVNTY